MKYLYLLQQALIWIITIYWAYQIVVSFCSLIKLKDKKMIINKEHKFMAIVPAHNEEAVIKNLVESLNAQDYPKELYDVYVIADNCTDATAEIAKNAGAKVYKRFDADNIVDKNFLKNMNKKLCQGEEIVQGYRDIKNPTDSWITAGYAIFYWMMNRFYHLARYNLGLSPLINGTGFMVKFDVVKPDGWQTITLTEDIEFSLINISKGRKLGWATDAIVYDEQPVHFDQSWSQRSRWTVGHLQCMKHYTKDLANGVKEHKTMMNFDGLLYMFGIPMMILTFLLLGVNTLLYLGAEMTFAELLGNYARYLIATFILPIITAIAIMLLDKREIKPMIFGLICYPLFLGSWILINIKCLIKPNTKWEKIEHVRDINIKEVA